MMVSMKVAIIGAGPAGLTAAYQLAKGGVDVEVFEASDQVGGMSRSIRLWNQTVDLGPHRFFSSDARVNRLWLEITERDYRMVDRLTRIYYGGKFFDYPLAPANALANLGLWEATRCVVSYLRQRVRQPGPAETFEDWVVQRFGRRLFEIFFKSYSEKLWGIPCHELDSDFAAQRIKKLSLGEAIRNALGSTRGKHRTLVDQFAYPLAGTGMVYERMADYVRSLGQVHLRRPVRNVLHDGRTVNGIELENGKIHAFDHVISTMPLTLLVKRMSRVPQPVMAAADRLKFRNTILVYLNVSGTDLFPDQWIYVHARELQVGRVTNFRNWVPELYDQQPTSILALEYWCYDDDAMWAQADDGLIQLASQEICKTGLIGDASVVDGHVVRVPKCYPVYAANYGLHLATVTDYLKTFTGLTPIGRYGAFKYNNQDHSILMGLLAAQNLLDSQQNDLWSVNTDYENYQESATITAAGLAVD